MKNIIPYLILIAIFIAVEFYVFDGFKLFISSYSEKTRRILKIVYLSISAVVLVGILLNLILDPVKFKGLKTFLTSAFFILFASKLLSAVFLAMDDIRRGITWLVNYFSPKNETSVSVSRSEFMTKTAIIAGAVPLTTLSFGIISGAHDYRVRRKTVYFKNLPKSFDGIRIAQVSDIHTGSFFNKVAVEGGVDMLLAEKPDVAFFTGDLVNNESKEAKEYLDIFKRIKAPLGTFSVMGNHDYGDYTVWSSEQAKQKDIENLHQMHHYMGYDLLLNENRTLKVGGEEIAILGCENWGNGRFAKYGDLDKTVRGSEEIPFKILLSHDPSHWDEQIKPMYSEIDLTLSGHTHGCQFGVEIGDFRWSPVQYRYKQWADLYKDNNQYLYVNRGYGYIGYPGRVGILPEITILELKREV